MVRSRLMVAGMSALLALGGLAWAVQEPVALVHMDYQAGRPLTPEEARLVAQCRSPGWTGLSRVIAQDLDVDCDPLWVSQTAASVADERAIGWITRARSEPDRSERARIRLDLALLYAGRTPSGDLAMLVADPTTSDALRGAVVEAILADEIASDWTDPALRTALAMRRFEWGEWREMATVERELRLIAADLHPKPAAERARLGRVALDAVGVSPDGLRIAFEARDAGYPWRGQPDHLSMWLARRGKACLEPDTPECLALAADLLARDLEEQQWVGDGGPSGPDEAARPVPVTLPMPLWNGLYPSSPDLTRAAAEELGAWAGFVTEVPESERAARLLAAVAPPRSRFGREEAEAGRVGDPVNALSFGGSAPWTTALAAVALADAAGVTLTVHGAPQGVVLRAGEHAVGVGPCGQRFAPPEVARPAVTVQRVLAGAAVEAAGGAFARGDEAAARRLAGLAERLDPWAARGAQAVMDELAGVPEAPSHRLGWSAGALVARAGTPPEGGGAPVAQLAGLRPAAECTVSAPDTPEGGLADTP